MKKIMISALLVGLVGTSFGADPGLKVSPMGAKSDFSFSSSQKLDTSAQQVLSKARANNVQNISVESKNNRVGVSVVFSDSVEYLTCQGFNLDKTSISLDVMQNKTIVSFAGEVYYPADTLAAINACVSSMNLAGIYEERAKAKAVQAWKDFTR